LRANLSNPEQPLTDTQKLIARLLISVLGSHLVVTALRDEVEAIFGS